MNMTPDLPRAGKAAFIFFLFSQGSFLAAPEYEMPAETRDARRIRERERLSALSRERRQTNPISATRAAVSYRTRVGLAEKLTWSLQERALTGTKDANTSFIRLKNEAAYLAVCDVMDPFFPFT